MDCWRRAVGRLRMKRITNDRVREIMEETLIVLDDIKDKQLICFGRVSRTPGERYRNRFYNGNCEEGDSRHRAERVGRLAQIKR